MHSIEIPAVHRARCARGRVARAAWQRGLRVGCGLQLALPRRPPAGRGHGAAQQQPDSRPQPAPPRPAPLPIEGPPNMSNIKRRLTLDAIMTALIAIEMFIQLTGVFWHEVIGFAFLATIAGHLVFERKWLKLMLGSAKARSRQKFRLVMSILLGVTLVMMAASSFAISTIIASTGVNLAVLLPYGTWVAVHTLSAYMLCALVAVHLISHWSIVAKTVHIEYDPSRRQAIQTGARIAAVGCAVAFGVAGFDALGVGGQVQGASDSGSGSGDGSSTGAGSSNADGSSATSGTSSSSTYTSSSSNQGRNWGMSSSSTSSGSGSSSITSSSGSSSGSTTTASGTCPLCHKQCSLSAPQCSRPYDAGLI